MRTESKENLVASQSTSESSLNNIVAESDVIKNGNEFDYVTEITLTPTEKRFLLTAERGEFRLWKSSKVRNGFLYFYSEKIMSSKIV